VYDYVDGKADWMAYDLPVEGDDGPFLGQRLEPVPTCDVALTVADARQAMDTSESDVVVLVDAAGLAVGEVEREALEGQADDVRLLEILAPVPSTVRPSVTVASVADAGGGQRLVTTSDGRLLGAASVEVPAATAGAPGHEGHDHEGHDHEGPDHEGHDHEGTAVDMERYEAELAAVMEAVEERFGDEEPPAEELRALLHDRLVADGRSPEEADRFLDDMEAGEAE
jgi:CBS domain-containing protein